MPRQIIQTSGPGASDQWNVVGAATSWEAVLRDSDDSSYITSNTAAQVSDFFCGAGYTPTAGRIMAVTMHYRMRGTAPGGAVDIAIVQGGTPQSAGTVNLPGTNWVDGYVRVREDWTTASRFTSPDVAALGVEVTVNTVPGAGALEVSKLWIEVEVIDTPWKYDPFDGALPDAVVGPLVFTTNGGVPAAITGNNYLRIDDTDPTDGRVYLRFDLGSPDPYKPEYVTEAEIRCTLSNLDPSPNALLAALGYAIDANANIILLASRLGGDLYLGLMSALDGTPLDIANYRELYPLDFDGEDIHIRLRADRDDTPSTYGKVEVFLNYEETPIMSHNLYDFPTATGGGSVIAVFGTGITYPALCRMDVDYMAWKAFKKRGSTFKAWKDFEMSTNEIGANLTDPDIVKPVVINPPGIPAGQSRHALELDVQDGAQFCEAYQIDTLPDPAPQTYKIDVDYKMDQAAVEGELVVQRTSDLWYWDETGGSWSSSYSSVTLANSTTRTRVAMMTGINVTDVAADAIKVTVKAKTATPPAYKILVYKVFLDRE